MSRFVTLYLGQVNKDSTINLVETSSSKANTINVKDVILIPVKESNGVADYLKICGKLNDALANQGWGGKDVSIIIGGFNTEDMVFRWFKDHLTQEYKEFLCVPIRKEGMRVDNVSNVTLKDVISALEFAYCTKLLVPVEDARDSKFISNIHKFLETDFQGIYFEDYSKFYNRDDVSETTGIALSCWYIVNH